MLPHIKRQQLAVRAQQLTPVPLHVLVPQVVIDEFVTLRSDHPRLCVMTGNPFSENEETDQMCWGIAIQRMTLY